jgi:hypothetical protein
MPDQIVRLLANFEIPGKLARCTEAIKASGHELSWTVLDRLQRAQSPDWESRDASTIGELLRNAGREQELVATADFGDDHLIPGHELTRVARGLRNLHRAGEVRGGDFNGYRIFARAYLGELLVPAYGRAPQDVLPQVVEHCERWYRILRELSIAEVT